MSRSDRMSAYEGQVVGSLNAFNVNAKVGYKINGRPLDTGDLSNNSGQFVTAAQVQADWTVTDSSSAQFVKNKPALVAIATTGSANDLLSGVVPVGSIPQLPAQQISSGNFQVGAFAVNVVPTVTGSQSLGASGLRWGRLLTDGVAIGKNSTTIQLDVVGQGALSGVNPQLSLVNPDPSATGQTPAEVLFDRTAAGSSLIGSVGIDATRGLYARVNGQDRLNIDTGGNVALSATLTALSVNTHQLGKFKISSFGNGTGSDFTGFGHGDVTGAGAAAVLARSDGTVYVNSGAGSGPRVILQNLGSSLIGMDSSGSLLPYTDGGQNLGSVTSGLRWGLLNVVNINCTGTLTYQGGALAKIATSGSAADLITGVAPLARIPSLPASQITSGTFLFNSGASVLFASNASPSTDGGVSLGAASLRWAALYVQNATVSQSLLCSQNVTANGNILAIDASGNNSVGTGIVKATGYDSNFANTSHTFGAAVTGAAITGTDASNLDSTRAQWRHRGTTQNATPVTAAFALQQTSAGATTLNALSGQAITLANNNSPQVTIGLGSILPANTLQVGLGSSSLRFLDCYARNLNLSGSAAMAQTLVVTATSSGATVARFNGVGGSGNVSNIDFSSFSDGSGPSWRWTQTDAGNNLAVLKLQRTVGGGSSASMTDVITHNTDSTIAFANQIRAPSIANLSNTSYFDGKVSQLVNDKNYTVSGSNVSQFNNDKNYTVSGSNVSQFSNDPNYTTSGSNISQFNNDRNYTTNGSNISQFNNDSGYYRNGNSATFSSVNATGTVICAPLNAYSPYRNGPIAAIFQPAYSGDTAIEVQWHSQGNVWAMGIGSGTGSYPNDFGLFSSYLGSAAWEVSSANGSVTMKKGYGTSDARLKQDIADLPYGLDLLCKLRPVEYRWKSGGDDDRKHWGLIAQDLQATLPQDVAVVQERSHLSVAYNDLTSLLIKAVQEQQAVLDKLQERVTALEKQHV